MIDLSAIKALELPKKKIIIQIAGEAQEVEIQAMGGRGLAANDHVDGPRSGEQYIMIALMYGAGMPEISARYLLENDYSAANQLAGEVFALTKEFIDARKNEQETAEKN